MKATLMDSIPLIKADDIWKYDAEGNLCEETGEECLNGSGTTIAIIDTGIDYTHPDLGGCFGENCKVVGGYDFVNDDLDPMDDHGHGTHCAATAAGNGILKGVAPGAKIYAYKVLNGQGSGKTSNIISAIERSVDPNDDGDFSDHIDVISLSLGGWGNPDDATSLAIDNAVEAGVSASISAGNNGFKESIGSPGTARHSITVGATEKDDYLASFSSEGPVRWKAEGFYEKLLNKPDVVAPGVEICAAQYDDAWSENECIDDEHTAISGTSMAAPHVAGFAAIIRQKNPDWDVFDVKNFIRETSVPINHYKYFDVSKIGRGRINASAVVGGGIYPNARL